ncbi:uncharacterized protein [Elaeis guineensis]|uniref:uncharacterized protein n=1 Tax=Elaeis guineensis var. tenera TaxID=51953 RepID=UPI003C6D706E
MSSVLVARKGRLQQRYEGHFRLVAGCIPYRLKADTDSHSGNLIDRLEVLMISSPNRDDLVFPKGGWENDETADEAACREAWEEAGVRGIISEKMLELREQATREVGSDGDTGSQQVCLMTDDTILDTVLGRQLGSGHSMRSKKSCSSSSGRSDDASVPEAVRTSMSMMQDQISYWMNRSQTLERIVAAVAERLGIDASELAPLQSHDAASAPPSRHVSGQGSTPGGGNEANESDHT